MGAAAPRSPFIRLDPRAGETLQAQIYGAVRRAILEGVLQPGAPLLSSRALAADLGVSRTTTLLAFEQLMAEGYLTAQRGSGTFVAEALPDDLPRVRVARMPTRLKHPPISRRGAALAATPGAAKRVPGPPRAFRIGVPALDLFPVRLWTQLVTRRLRSVTRGQLDYGDVTGLAELREAIADHVRTARGTTCVADQVIVVAGAQRGLELVCRMLLDPGDRAWVEDPGYPGARSALVSAGARILHAPVDDQGIDVEVIARHPQEAKLVYVTPSHQFPLGVPMSLARRLALLRWASAARAWVIEDDYDSEFRYHTRAVPCLHGLDVDGRVIYVGSFSKTLFPALRLGFLIVPPDLQDTVRAIRRAGEQHPPILDQAALADLMAGGHFDRHLRRMRAAYQERLEALAAAIDRDGAGVLRLRPPQTGLHAVADLEGVDAVRAFEEALARGVEVMPLSAYGFGRTKPPNGLVIGFAAVRPDAIARGMERLVAAIEAARRSAESRAGDADARAGAATMRSAPRRASGSGAAR
jgi:GntR family transcriptional regulator/MocR family aminotransferase